MTASTVEPGTYDYSLKVEFDSIYIPEHTPPLFRNDAAQPTTRFRHAWNQIEISARLDRDALRDYLVQQICDDLFGQEVRVVQFDLNGVANPHQAGPGRH